MSVIFLNGDLFNPFPLSMPSISLITSRSSSTVYLSCFCALFLELSWTNPTIMDHPFMHSRRASTSMFSFKAAAETLKVKEEEEGYDDSAEEEEEGDEEGEEIEVEESYPKKKRMDLGGGLGKKGSTAVAGGGAGGGVLAVTIPLPPGCQVDKCVADLTDSKRYHQRHKVCEYHSKAQVVMVAGLRQRFCQQCSRFHDLSEFDDAKRSCRRRLAGHNERRRKNFCESRGEGAVTGRRGSATQMDKKQCRQIDERGRSQIALSENTQNFHIH